MLRINDLAYLTCNISYIPVSTPHNASPGSKLGLWVGL